MRSWRMIGCLLSAVALAQEPPVTVTLAPAAVSLYSGQTQSFTATVTNTTNGTVTWSLNPDMGTISATGLYTPPYPIASAQIVTITATSVADPTKNATATVTLNPAGVVDSVSPDTVAPGGQVAVTGSGFGSAQGTGSVWLGSAPGTVISWSDTEIVAAVALNSVSGTARVRQGAAWSNNVPLTVNTAAIATVSPDNGVPGTQVTITGSGFGASQGSGNVWLGTAPGVVQTWSDTQVVAVVSAGSASGNARLLQNGVLSNALPFTVNSLHIESVDPAEGPPGTSVTIIGSGFGSTQGSGTVVLGSVAGQVTSWSNTQVVAAVASGALSGFVRIQQNGIWSNALTFTVTQPDGSSTVLSPNLMTMLVGETRTIQALDAARQPVTGLTWTSSDPAVVSLSTGDPPVLTALAAGHVTISAGSASADVTVSTGDPAAPGTLPLGTVLWSVPGNVQQIVPAVPSPNGVADVFAFGDDGTVQAITSEGVTAWSANDARWGVPDFQGGLVTMFWDESDNSRCKIARIDGITGQRIVIYVSPQPWNDGCVFVEGVHPDGTIFAYLEDYEANPPRSLIGIDPATGAQKFNVPIEHSNGGGVRFLPQDFIVAGDGYAYLTYVYREEPDPSIIQLDVLRVSSSGVHETIHVLDWPSRTYEWDFLSAATITNADQGIMLTWTGTTDQFCCNYQYQSGIAMINGSSVSHLSGPSIGQTRAIVPALQAQDGSFIATAENWNVATSYMIAFDQTGALRWSVPGNWQPQIATADGGVIATDEDTGAAVVFDQNGNVTGQMASLPVQSWMGNEYTSSGSVSSISLPPLFPDGSSFWANAGGNPSGNWTAFPQCPCLLQSAGAAPSPASSPSHVIRTSSNRMAPHVARSDAPLKTYIILEGDPGLSLPGHRPHNVGALFHLAAETEQDAMNAQGNLAANPKKVSTVQDFAAQMKNNGPITGGVVYFGHGAGHLYGDGTSGSMLAPGEQAGPDTNITADNVNELSNEQLATDATITLHACYAGFGSGRYSIAKLIANQLQRKVYAPTAGTFFSVDPNSHFTGATAPPLPDRKPIYQLQDFGKPFQVFWPL